jgi:hypothetical protein
MWGLPQRDARPSGRALSPIRHAYSHFRLELVPVLADEDAPAAGPVPARAPEDGAVAADARWVAPHELDGLPLSIVDRTAVARLREAGLLGSPS